MSTLLRLNDLLRPGLDNPLHRHEEACSAPAPAPAVGSGVTEAACKTVFTQRFKRSGMRWQRESGQVILDLRVIHLSGIWEEAFAADLAGRTLPESRGVPGAPVQEGSPDAPQRARSRLAA
jgi:hypothetical protein